MNTSPFFIRSKYAWAQLRHIKHARPNSEQSYFELGNGNVRYTAYDCDEVEHVPRVAEIILKIDHQKQRLSPSLSFNLHISVIYINNT